MNRRRKKVSAPKKKDTLWIVDLDYALLDLYRFMDDVGAALKREFGISEELYKQSKIEVQNTTLYSFERHVRAMQKKAKLPYKDAMRRIGALMKTYQQYYFSDTLPFLRSATKQGEFILLSYGHSLQQRRKIKALGIEKFCDRVIITSTKAKKAEWVKKLAKRRKRVIVVNDDPKETLAMAAALKDSDAAVKKVILIERPEGKYFPIPPHKDYVVVRDLRKIEKLL